MINKGRTRRWARPYRVAVEGESDGQARTLSWARVADGAPVTTDGGPQPDFGDTSDPATQTECDHIMWDFSVNKCMDCGLRANPGDV